MNVLRSIKLPLATAFLVASAAAGCSSDNVSISTSKTSDATTTTKAPDTTDGDSASGDSSSGDADSSSVLVFDGESIALSNVSCQFELNLSSDADIAAFQGTASGVNAAGDEVTVEGAAVDLDGATGNTINIDIGSTEWTGRFESGTTTITNNVIKTAEVTMESGGDTATANLTVDCG